MQTKQDLSPTAGQLREAFDAHHGFTIGVEEEVMLLDPRTLDLAPCAEAALKRVAGDPRFKLEMPASQLEILTEPLGSAAAVGRALAAARRDLAGALEGMARVASAGTHPMAAQKGELNRAPRYEPIAAEFGPAARRQLVCALQIHVAVPGADRALAVYNALRSHLPAVAALAANAPFYDGSDSAMASVRPAICLSLPRQGVPPVIGSWESLADELAWGARAGSLPEPGRWWWELRPHPTHGTLEVRVPDAQITVADSAAVAAVVHALVRWLADRHDAGEELEVAPTWRIAENRWSAARHGLSGGQADLRTGERVATRDHLAALLHTLAPVAEAQGAATELAHARRMLAAGGAERQRAVAAERGVIGLVGWLADGFAAAATG